MAQIVKNLPAMQDTQVRSLDPVDPLEKEMATHSSILIWRIPWTEKPGALQSMGSQRVGHDWATFTFNSVVFWFTSVHTSYYKYIFIHKYSCCSVTKLCLILCDPMDYSMAGFCVLLHLPEFAQTHVHLVNDAIKSSHPQSSPSHLALNLSQHQGLFKWVDTSNQVAKVLELQLQLNVLQHQSFLWIFKVDFL